MANPQPRHFVKISQELLEALYRAKLSGAQWQVVMFIVRLTYGFSRKEVSLLIKHFSRGFGEKKGRIPGTGLNRYAVHRAVNNLLIKNIIIIEPVENSNFVNYSIQKDYDLWHNSFQQKVSQKCNTQALSQKCNTNVSKVHQSTGLELHNCHTLLKIDRKDNDREKSQNTVACGKLLKNDENLRKARHAEEEYFLDNTGQTITEKRKDK